jgi:Cu+-exporting ATPase
MSNRPPFVDTDKPIQGVSLDKEAISEQKKVCFHCGTLCRDKVFSQGEKYFCCNGCLTVFELLSENGLGEFYNLSETAGVRVTATALADRYLFLDEPLVRDRLVDFASDRITRVTFHVPSIHCIACVWLLENLFQLRAGIKESRVNFPRREVLITFDNTQVKLSEVVTLLASLGYEPELKLSSLDTKSGRNPVWKLWIQLGFAGFAFGNIMLLSLAAYFGLDTFTAGPFRRMTGYISLILALPVVIYSARDYWRAAWRCLHDRVLNIDVPIAVGVAAIFMQSTFDVVTGRGNGYFDSLCGLIFFLLCGKLFQQKNYDRLTFDRSYKSFFPLSVTRLANREKTTAAPADHPVPSPLAGERVRVSGETNPIVEEQISLSQLTVGERLILRNGELIPADATLMGGPALIDYSFVTGESEPVGKNPGDHLYAGGRQMGGRIEIETVKPVSQSYLTSLWDQDSFRKDKNLASNALTNQYSQRFTRIIIGVAVTSAGYWAWVNPALSLKAFTSVLIVACPCALALAAPFALGTAQRLLARRGVYLKNPYVLENLARIDTVVFDKTGTLTGAGASKVDWQGPVLTENEERWLFSITRHSTHPLAVRIGEFVKREHFPDTVRSFLETEGCGMEANVAGNEIWVGSAAWLETRQVFPTENITNGGSAVHVAINGQYRGCFVLANALRENVGQAVSALAKTCKLALLSGDNETEREKFHNLFGDHAELRFNQSPSNKLEFVRDLQSTGRSVMMVGDGLNDAGALKQADVGVAVVENAGAFSPASDVILSATMVSQLDEIKTFARRSVLVVRAAFIISSIYNVIGISIAASGRLSPVVCAVLMPVSSVSVISFACLMASWNARIFKQFDYARRHELASFRKNDKVLT